jgi:hypothetical protein
MAEQFDFHQRRFKLLWQEWSAKWRDGNVLIENSGDLGRCISIVARIALTNVSQAAQLLAASQEVAGEHCENLYVYPLDSLHISLIGCTQRRSGWDLERARKDSQRIASTVRPVVGNFLPQSMEIGPVSVCGSSIFAEVYPESEDWSAMRRIIGVQLAEQGFDPIVYKDTRPVHLNLARLLPNAKPAAFLSRIESSREKWSPLKLEIDQVECILTDFVLTPTEVEVFSKFKFDDSNSSRSVLRT